jgi:hypothetical protein
MTFQFLKEFKTYQFAGCDNYMTLDGHITFNFKFIWQKWKNLKYYATLKMNENIIANSSLSRIINIIGWFAL